MKARYKCGGVVNLALPLFYPVLCIPSDQKSNNKKDQFMMLQIIAKWFKFRKNISWCTDIFRAAEGTKCSNEWSIPRVSYTFFFFFFILFFRYTFTPIELIIFWKWNTKVCHDRGSVAIWFFFFFALRWFAFRTQEKEKKPYNLWRSLWGTVPLYSSLVLATQWYYINWYTYNPSKGDSL